MTCENKYVEGVLTYISRKTGFDLLDIILTDDIHDICRQKDFIIRRPQMAQSIFPKELGDAVGRLCW